MSRPRPRRPRQWHRTKSGPPRIELQEQPPGTFNWLCTACGDGSGGGMPREFAQEEGEKHLRRCWIAKRIRQVERANERAAQSNFDFGDA